MMIPELRKELILKTLNEADVVYTHKIMKQCDVSELTIRRDLIELESQGLLVRTRKGAMKSKVTNMMSSYDLKINRHRQQKEAICRLAANYIHEGDIIFIDCGTTLSLLSKYISKINGLTVISTSIPVISELIKHPNIRLSLIGGEIDVERQATYGSVAENDVGYFHANKAFIGVDGISLKKGLSTNEEKEGATTQKMIENSDEVFLLCDSSKIEKNSYMKFASVAEIHHLITDRQITPEQLKMYQDAGVDVIFEPQQNELTNP